MSRRRFSGKLSVYLVLSGVLAAAAREAGADERLQGIISTATGVTDNVLSAADGGEPGPEADGFSTISPGLRFSVEGPRAVHVLLYMLTANLYYNHSEANSFSNRLQWQAAFNTSPTTQLLTGLSGTHGQLNTFDTSSPSATGDPTALPPGSEFYLNADAYQGYLWDVTPVWHVEESLRVAYHRSLEDPALTPDTWDVNLTGSVERAFKYDSFAVMPRLGYTLTEYEPMDSDLPDQHLITTGLEARWRHDIGNYWTTESRLGGVFLLDAQDAGRTAGPYPVGAGILRYVHPEGTASLTLARSVRANLFTGSNYVAEEAILYGALPLRPLTPRLTITGSTAIQRGRTIDLSTDDLEQTTFLYIIDVGMAYEVVTGGALAFRYQYHNQDNDDPPPMAEGALGDYQRHTALVSFTYVYPARAAAAIPFRSPLRVDREDQSPIWNDERTDPARQTPPSP